ncbi:hypothetical protein F511_11686 [Dorcoceras hygrometricum]|uniref:Uncharacterized protein n=1 Tax=Dorcoceras hygrometricum TaxID=472368 RepID=A0A2Z7CBP1_9LAMI|nr:hypothetical protein F511_11686 [Dorcoceras hygrometricum]
MDDILKFEAISNNSDTHYYHLDIRKPSCTLQMTNCDYSSGEVPEARPIRESSRKRRSCLEEFNHYTPLPLNYEITENRGDNLAQDTHQSRRNLPRDKCHSASLAEQRVQRRVKRSSPPPSPSINT